jgi:Ala-tRNA(Pro) deacylase
MKEKLMQVKEVYETLKALDIKVESISHPEVKKCEQSKLYYDKAGYDTSKYGLCKNIFIRDKKGKKFWLVILDYCSDIDMDILRSDLESSKLGPATKENLSEILGVESGSVSLFSILNDKAKKVEVIIDRKLIEKEKLAFHPNYSGITTFISKSDAVKFLEASETKYKLMDIPTKKCEEQEYSDIKVLTKKQCVNYGY